MYFWHRNLHGDFYPVINNNAVTPFNFLFCFKSLTHFCSIVFFNFMAPVRKKSRRKKIEKSREKEMLAKWHEILRVFLWIRQFLRLWYERGLNFSSYSANPKVLANAHVIHDEILQLNKSRRFNIEGFRRVIFFFLLVRH